MKTLLITDDDLTPAAESIQNGGLVAVPTETVYGLAANGLDAVAVRKLYDVKGRPETKPLNLLVSGMADVQRLCRGIPDAAYALAERFWPGPLTIVLNKTGRVPDIITAGGDTVGVRCPDHFKTLRLMELSGVPLAAPSANRSGEPSLKTAGDVLRVFDGLINAVIDGGPCGIGVESTIVGLAEGTPVLFRRGGLPAAEIERVLGVKLIEPQS